MNVIPVGKAPWSILIELIKKQGYTKNLGIIQAAEQGIDVAVLDIASITKTINATYKTNELPYLIYKSDPITFPTPNPAAYLIMVNKNDLATAGALPFGILVTILLPPNCTPKDLLIIQKNLSKECNKNKITILGGHTEITENVVNPILSASMIGFVPPTFYIPRNVFSGDAIICSGWVGAEGTGILITEGLEVFKKHLTPEEIQTGMKIGREIDISDRIISCNKEFHHSIHLVHDATEGGILGAIYECIAPKGFGCEIDSAKIPISSITKKITSILDIDPKKLISSGAVLILCPEIDSISIIKFLRHFDVPAEIIGKVTDSQSPLLIDGEDLTPPESDHLISGLSYIRRSK
ncbi:MAG: hypothetical protein EAX86_02595 [Candidatus Heimdallarchaeota archaeon]|nr:hypothetical protein [Candidatus Heimdallarchaeota archaeon]